MNIEEFMDGDLPEGSILTESSRKVFFELGKMREAGASVTQGRAFLEENGLGHIGAMLPEHATGWGKGLPPPLKDKK